MNIKFIKFNPDNQEHISLLAQIKKEEPSLELVKENKTLLIVKTEADLIGAVALYEAFKRFKNALSADIVVLKKYQSQGYGTEINKELPNLTKKYDGVLLDIANSNQKSINAAKKAGYKIDYGIASIFDEEGYQHTPFFKSSKH